MLGLIASREITCWFAEQSIMMEAIEETRAVSQGIDGSNGDAAA
jgi:hypothetical protein